VGRGASRKRRGFVIGRHGRNSIVRNSIARLDRVKRGIKRGWNPTAATGARDEEGWDEEERDKAEIAYLAHGSFPPSPSSATGL